MKVTYDKEADALYLYLAKGKIRRTRRVSSRILVDLDAKDRTLGVEVLDLGHFTSPLGRAKKAVHSPLRMVEKVRQLV